MAERLVLRENLGYKKDALLGYSPTSVGTFIPVPISFSRASSASGAGDGFATRGYSVPRIKSDGALLLEPSRTNLLLRSEEFDNAAWTKTNTTISADAEVAPDGTTTMDAIIASATGGVHYVDQSATVSSSVVYQASGYFKQKDAGYYALLRFNVGTPFATEGVIVDLSDGSIVDHNTEATPIVMDYGNGIYKIIIQQTANASGSGQMVYGTTTQSNILSVGFTGDGVSGVYAWGAQLEIGSYPTSYIPTTSSTVTRAAESVSQTGLASLLGDSEGAILFEASTRAIDNVRVAISDGTSANRVTIGVQTAGTYLIDLVKAGAIEFRVNTGTYTDDEIVKIAVAYETNRMSVYVNGSKLGEDLLGSTFAASTLTNLQFNVGDGSSAPFYGNVKELRVYDTALTDAELEALTS